MFILMLKRLYVYLLKGYLGTFLATFFVCLFIVLMQFLWRYVDDMVGKGLSISVLGQFFYYAAMSLIPMALPLSILLSSLMTFGNLGEKMELIAMKASGISLFRIMRPFVGFVLLISIGAFFYSNMALPAIQKNLYILARSMSEKSPEVEIPEGSFYQGIPNISFYVRQKDPKTKMLRDLMIYDFSNNTAGTGTSGSSLSDNVSIICADSGRLETTKDGANMVLTLYKGETFENMKVQKGSKGNNAFHPKSVPYRRESFNFKQILIPFDNSFKEVDASVTSNKYVGKNIAELTHVVDSLGVVSKELGDRHANTFVNETYFDRNGNPKARGTLDKLVNHSNVSINDIWVKLSVNKQREILADANSTVIQINNELEFMFGEKDYSIDRNARRHDIERHRKFTLSVACLLFFFIGAPLGAIIRKGGLGLPIVISVLIFIIYYVVDNSGYKLAREGRWLVWQGIWLSSAVLLPIGVFLTYKAATESTVNINKENFKKFLAKFSRKRNKQIDGDGQQ